MNLNVAVYSSTIVVVVLALLMAFKHFFNIRKPKTHNSKEEDDMLRSV